MSYSESQKFWLAKPDISRVQKPRAPIHGRKKPPRKYLSEAQKKELRDAFELFDFEKTGRIGYHEVKVAMKALGYPVKKNEVLQLVNKVDREGVGTINIDDFLDINKVLARDPVDDLREAFSLFDSDGNGRIFVKNLRRIAKELGEDISDEELQAMIDEFDQNQDGAIDQQEFFNIMRMDD